MREAGRWTGTRRGLAVFAAFAGISALFVNPLFRTIDTHLAIDAGDPALNASILWWNATRLPLTEAWWSQPWFHPTPGVTAFTENLLGLWPIASPIYWLTGDPIVTYNLVFYASWPLSAFACYWLVRRLTQRTDAGIIAGLAFGFAPYRISAEAGHLQTLSLYWLPIALASMHAHLETGQRRWLAIFGATWVLQSLANGYYLLFGAVLLALWFAYFGTTARTWRGAARLGAAWALASLALAPIFIRYQQIHEQFGFRRTLLEAAGTSAHADSWLQVSTLVRLWDGILPSGQDTLFPGLTVVLLVLAATVMGLSRAGGHGEPSRARRVLQPTLAVLTMLSLALVAIWFAHGSLVVRSGDLHIFSMRDPDRALVLAAFCGLPILWLSPLRHAIRSRHPLIFYGASTVVMAILACGPMLHAQGEVVLDPAPYRWLMALPGFDGLRVPSRFWMMGVLCLAVAAGLGFAAVTRRLHSMRAIVFVAAVAGILADGWPKAMPVKPAQERWTSVAGSDSSLPLLELPLGPNWDAAATLRVTAHRRPVMNGVSGYDPPHYQPLQVGLRAADPEMLAAIASLGPYEISVESANDRDGLWRRYASEAPDAVLVADDGRRAIFRVPERPREEPSVGAALPIVLVTSERTDPRPVFDRRTDTPWVDFPQDGSQWLLADLGGIRDVGGVSLATADYAADFPRRLAVDVSVEGRLFTNVHEGNAAAVAFLEVLRAPRSAWLRLAFPAQVARFVRVRQTARARAGWIVAELEVNAPAARTAAR